MKSTMQRKFEWIGRTAALMFMGALVTTPVFADKPEWAGGGKKQEERGGKKDENRGSGKQHDRDDDRGGKHGDRGDRHFDEHQYVVVREYYAKEHRAGHCPPGLAKKHNGCMPPGQAKKWHKGQPLPREVIYYNPPPQLVVQLGVPPSGHKYVRVASDILLIAIGTGMVVDAIEDLGRM